MNPENEWLLQELRHLDDTELFIIAKMALSRIWGNVRLVEVDE